MAQAEPLVYEVVEKTEFYTLYQRVKMEEAMNVFYQHSEIQILHPVSVYDTTVKDSLRWIDLTMGWNTDDCRSLYINMDAIYAHLRAQFSDPKVKSVPMVFPYEVMYYVNGRFNDNDVPFKYSSAKNVFLRKPAPKDKVKISKAPILEMQRHMAKRLNGYLSHYFTYVKLTSTGSKVQMHNAVVILKQLGIKLEGEKFDNALAAVIKEYDLNESLTKQLIETITNWWNEAGNTPDCED